MRRALVVLIAVALLGCRTDQTLVTPDPHLQRMLKQEKRLAYEEDPVLPHGMAMQTPPPGTLPAETLIAAPLVLYGVARDRWAERIPVPLDRPKLEDGQRRYETFCVPCHGELGDGNTVVAERMTLRKPQNLLEDTVRAYSVGRLFQTIRQGYGLMPSYAVQLSVGDTWNVVAYVRALQLARGVPLAELPGDVRVQLEKEAP